MTNKVDANRLKGSILNLKFNVCPSLSQNCMSSIRFYDVNFTRFSESVLVEGLHEADGQVRRPQVPNLKKNWLLPGAENIALWREGRVRVWLMIVRDSLTYVS